MNLRLSIVLTSFVSTLVVLFALWFIYGWWFVEKPLEKDLAAIDGVREVSVARSRQHVQVNVTLHDDAQLKAVHEAILEKVKPLAKGRALNVKFQDNPTEEMKEAWHQLQFDVEEALSHHRYRDLPEIAAKMKEQLQLELATADMNGEYVYFQFQKGEHRFYHIYPRKQGEEGIRG